MRSLMSSAGGRPWIIDGLSTCQLPPITLHTGHLGTGLTALRPPIRFFRYVPVRGALVRRLKNGIV